MCFKNWPLGKPFDYMYWQLFGKHLICQKFPAVRGFISFQKKIGGKEGYTAPILYTPSHNHSPAHTQHMQRENVY